MQICEELETLQCCNDFSNLDENAASGAGGNAAELTIRTKLKTRTMGRLHCIHSPVVVVISFIVVRSPCSILHVNSILRLRSRKGMETSK